MDPPPGRLKMLSELVTAVLASWSIPFWATLGVLLTSLLYIRGWIALRQLRSTLLPNWRLACLLAGMASFWLAIASPLDAFASFLLTFHMVQHMLIMLVAPPLILLASPLNPVLRGLPLWATRDALGPFLNWPLLKRIGRALTHPAVCWLAAVAVLLAGTYRQPMIWPLPLWLARGGARLPFRNFSAILVARHPALAQHRALAPLEPSPPTC